MASTAHDFRRWVAATGAVLSIAMLAACGAEPAAMVNPTTDPLANLIVRDSTKPSDEPSGGGTPPGDGEVRNLKVGSPMHVEIVQTSDTGVLYVSGDVDPDGAVPQAALRVGFEKGESAMEWTLVGGSLYGKANPGGWTDLGPVSGYVDDSSSSGSTLAKMYVVSATLAVGEPAVALFEENSADIKSVGTEKVGGVEAEVITLTSGDLDAKAWINPDGAFLKITLSDKSDSSSTEWIFSNLSKPISVTAPM